MPSEEPRAEQIAEAIVTALETVKVEEGYWTDLGARIGRRRWEVQKLQQTKLPNGAVWIADWKPDPSAACIGPTWALYRMFGVELWYRSEKAEDVDRDGARIEEDAIHAVMATGNLGLEFVYALDAVKGQADHQQYGDPNMGWKLIWFGVGYKDSTA